VSTPFSPHSAIIDFAESLDGAPVRRRFVAPSRVIRATSIAEVVAAIDEAEQLARDGFWVVGYVAYDAAPAFDGALAAHPPASLPLAWFAVFETPDLVGPSPAAHSDSTDGSGDSSHVLVPTTGDTDDGFARRIAVIHEYIGAGDVYQVNLTVPFTAASNDTPLAVYERMRLAQGGRYSAYLDIGGSQIMSASPELFLARHGSTVLSRPMKGTAPRALHVAADHATRDALLRSEKERAENVMIVDVVRNDLGRVAKLGTVSVSELCSAERYPSVWQLTSTVSAEVESGTPLSSLFSALFPAASITGAPKIRATEIIRELETSPRGVYCGAVGLIRPGGDAEFNVAIRTAWTDDDGRTLHLNAGGGVTIDSTSEGELAEVRTKLSAFTAPRCRPALFETIRIESGHAMRLTRHLARMSASADYFDIAFDASIATELLRGTLAAESNQRVERARLVLEPSGQLSVTVQPFIDEWPSDRARPVTLAEAPVNRRELRLYHKTTSRETYDRALASAPDMFDVLFWNEDGEATELTRGNLVAQIDGARWTPPVECGLLGGTLRAELLEAGEIAERIISLEELPKAERLWFVNALRGWISIELV
jgi:para-aminobenzoate synthetase / 4-amino-4-deoxychorismate lyase